MKRQLNRWRFGRIARLLVLLYICSAFNFAELGRSQQQSSSQQQAPSQTPGESSSTPAAATKPKRVWTNEDMGEVKKSSVSEAGQPKLATAERNGSRPSAAPSAQVVAAYRKQLAALEAQQASIEKQIADLKDFNRGEPGQDIGLQLHKRYTNEPINEQIRKLEAKHKQVAEQIDALVDAARKKGVESRQLH